MRTNVLYGGLDASNNLTLESTSNVTKGDVISSDRLVCSNGLSITAGEITYQNSMIETYRNFTIAFPTTTTSGTPDTAIAINLDTDMLTTHNQNMTSTNTGVITYSGTTSRLVETTYNMTFHSDKKCILTFYAVSDNTGRYGGGQVISSGPTLPAGAIPASVVSEDYDTQTLGEDAVVSLHFFWHADNGDKITLYVSSDTATTAVACEKLTSICKSMSNTP